MINKPKVTVLIPMRNSVTTIGITLDSLAKQNYPIEKIIVLDNVSTDGSVEFVENYSRKTKLKIAIIKRKKDVGVGVNYNLGAKKAKTKFIVFMHSDSQLKSKNELERLVSPLLKTDAIAAYSSIILPREVWSTYPFWQRFLFCRVVDSKAAGMNGKFDCLNRYAFLKSGGYNSVDWDATVAGEDAELHIRMEKFGKVLLSRAVVIHLHYLGSNFSFRDMLKTRKLLARTYGRLVRLQYKNMSPKSIAFAIKPSIALFSFFGIFNLVAILPLLIYSVVYSMKMFSYLSFIKEPKLLLVPFVNIFLIYYETYWMATTFFYKKNK